MVAFYGAAQCCAGRLLSPSVKTFWWLFRASLGNQPWNRFFLQHTVQVTAHVDGRQLVIGKMWLGSIAQALMTSF